MHTDLRKLNSENKIRILSTIVPKRYSSAFTFTKFVPAIIDAMKQSKQLVSIIIVIFSRNLWEKMLSLEDSELNLFVSLLGCYFHIVLCFCFCFPLSWYIELFPLKTTPLAHWGRIFDNHNRLRVLLKLNMLFENQVPFVGDWSISQINT